jgi:hypothetical protein
MGRFMSPDPVIVTPERLMNPQQLNLYSYVSNNPMRYTDPTGEVLVAADGHNDYHDLCQIVGDACKDRLKIDDKTGIVTFDTNGLDLSKNEGANLLNDLVSSNSTYEFSEGPTVETSTGPVKIDDIKGNIPELIANFPSFASQNGDNGRQPKAGVADVVGIDVDNGHVGRSNANYKNGPGLFWTVAFHELAEAYEKIDHGQRDYTAGHNAAVQREQKLRDERPSLKDYAPGSGDAGSQIIRK